MDETDGILKPGWEGQTKPRRDCDDKGTDKCPHKRTVKLTPNSKPFKSIDVWCGTICKAYLMDPLKFTVCDEILCENRCREGGKGITPETCDYRKMKGLEYEGMPHKTCSTCDGYTTNEEPTICNDCKDEQQEKCVCCGEVSGGYIICDSCPSVHKDCDKCDNPDCYNTKESKEREESKEPPMIGN